MQKKPFAHSKLTKKNRYKIIHPDTNRPAISNNNNNAFSQPSSNHQQKYAHHNLNHNQVQSHSGSSTPGLNNRMINYASTTAKGGHFYKSSYGGGFFNHGSMSNGTNTPIPHSTHGSPLPSFLPNSSSTAAASSHHHHQIYSNIKGLTIPSPPLSRSAAPSPNDSFSNNHRITHHQSGNPRKKGGNQLQEQQQEQQLGRTVYSKTKKLPSTSNNSPCGIYDDEFYRSQQVAKQQSSIQRQQQNQHSIQGSQMIVYGNNSSKQDQKLIMSPEDMASYSFRKKVYHHKKSASTLSPQISTMLGKYSNVANQVIPDSNSQNNQKKAAPKFINKQQKIFSNLNIGISDPINKQQRPNNSKNATVSSSSTTPNNLILQNNQNQNFLHHHLHHHQQLQQNNNTAEHSSSSGSYIVQIHQHSHQHQYHYHLSDQQKHQQQPSPHTSSTSYNLNNNATLTGSRPTTGGGDLIFNFSDIPNEHQTHQQIQQNPNQHFRKPQRFISTANTQNPVAKSQVFENAGGISAAAATTHSNSANKKPLHMRTKSDHMFQNLPASKINNSAALKNNFMRNNNNNNNNNSTNKKNNNKQSSTNNQSISTVSTSNHNNSKYISSIFKKQQQNHKASSQVPHLPLRKVLNNNNLLNQSQSGYSTPKIPSARGVIQQQPHNNLIQNQIQYETLNTPGSNSSRLGSTTTGGVVGAGYRKSSITTNNGSTGKKSPGFGSYSISGVANTATPNFKSSIGSSIPSNSAKKNMLFNNNSPIPHPSHSQHVTPKSSNYNNNRKLSASSGSTQNTNSRSISKTNNNCMIGIGKGLPPGQQVALQLRQEGVGVQLSLSRLQNNVYKKTPNMFHKRSTSEGTPSQIQMLRKNQLVTAGSVTHHHNPTAIPAAPISGSDLGLKRYYAAKNQERRVQGQRLSCVDQEIQQHDQNVSTSSLIVVNPIQIENDVNNDYVNIQGGQGGGGGRKSSSKKKKYSQRQNSQHLSSLRQNTQQVDLVKQQQQQLLQKQQQQQQQHYKNNSNLKKKSFRFKKDDVNSSSSSLQNNSMQSVSQSMNQQLLPRQQLSPRSSTFQKYSFYIGAPGGQQYGKRQQNYHQNYNQLTQGGNGGTGGQNPPPNHQMAISSELSNYKNLQEKRQVLVDKNNKNKKKIQIRSTPVSNMNSLQIVASNESQKGENIVHQEEEDSDNMMLILDENSSKQLQSSLDKNQAIKGSITKIPSVRQAYGLSNRQNLQNSQNQVYCKSQSPQTEPIKSNRLHQKQYEGIKSSMVSPPPPSNLKQYPGQFVRRKSSSISSQKDINSSNQHSNIHHFRKGSHPITSQVSNNINFKKSSTKIYYQQIKDTKHKASNSLAINNNIIKTSGAMANNKKFNQATPKSARGPQPYPQQNSQQTNKQQLKKQNSPTLYKTGNKLDDLKKKSPPNSALISKPHKALINHQNSKVNKAAPTSSRYELVDLTPPISGLNLGQAGETIQNLLPRQQTTTSACELTPRSKNKHKLTRYIKAYFQRFKQAPQTTADFYRVGKMLGRGAFGKVNLALHKMTNQLVAVKSMNKTMLQKERSKRKVLQEITILKRIRHPHIVNLFETFQTKKHILFVMELCAGGDLLNYVRKRRRLKEPLAKFVFMQIVSDIKLDNILLDAYGHVKICDFGVSKIVRMGERIKDQCGTPAYIAPEILLDEGYEGYTVDIWSVGVVLYAMLYGTVPFKANCMKDLHKLIIDAEYTLKEDISQDARDLLRKILEPNPAKRYTMQQILQHSWMQDIDNTLTLFTETEKRIIRSEFTYNDCRRYNRNENSDIFTEHQLDTQANELQRNISQKSIILAPFNSTKSHISTDFHDSVEELVRTRAAIRFGAKVREIDRQYQQNNNNQLDNGVYNKYICEEREQELLSPDIPPGTPRSPRKQNSFLQLDNQTSLLNQNKGANKKSQLEKLQKAMDGVGGKLDKLRQFDEEDKSAAGGIYNLVMQQELQDDIIQEVVLCGYPRGYVIKSLKAKEANYATTTYYLLQSIKAGFAFNVFREAGDSCLGFSIEKANEKLKETLNTFRN